MPEWHDVVLIDHATTPGSHQLSVLDLQNRNTIFSVYIRALEDRQIDKIAYHRCRMFFLMEMKKEIDIN